MLYGTDLTSAYSNDFDPTPKQATLPKPIVQQNVQKEPRKDPPSLDPSFLTSDQKLHMLSNELLKQKEMFEQNKNNSYVDKLLSKKRDIMKLLIISFVFLLAISLHSVVDYYLKKYLEDNVLSGGKEFLLRSLYPVAVLLALWNIKAFNK
jgi:hypothetical protein